MRRAVVLILLALLPLGVTACGSEEEPTSSPPPPAVQAPPPATGTTTTTDGPPTTDVVVYFLREGRVAPARRTITAPQAFARAALEALFAGPTDAERDAGLTTRAPASTRITRLAVADGTAAVVLDPCPPMEQVVFTLTQFPTVERVESPCIEGGQALARADLEEAMPAILVEIPAAGDTVGSPLQLRGSANTFEATFQYELLDADGRVVASDFVTATSGSGTRGTFDVTVPFEVERRGGKLVVFEASAEDGSRIHVVEIPLRLQPG